MRWSKCAQTDGTECTDGARPSAPPTAACRRTSIARPDAGRSRDFEAMPLKHARRQTETNLDGCNQPPEIALGRSLGGDALPPMSAVSAHRVGESRLRGSLPALAPERLGPNFPFRSGGLAEAIYGGPQLAPFSIDPTATSRPFNLSACALPVATFIAFMPFKR